MLEPLPLAVVVVLCTIALPILGAWYTWKSMGPPPDVR